MGKLLTSLAGFLMRSAGRFEQQPSGLKLLQVLSALSFVGLFDSITGYQVSFAILYGVLIYAAAWLIDRQTGILIALLCALSWWWAGVIGGRPYLNNLQEIWETFIGMSFFVFVAVGSASLRREHDAAATQIALLEHSRRLEREIIEISEREQRRIGRDLHDGLCQYQAALACAAASLNGALRKKDLAEEAERANELAVRLRDAVAQTRSLARGLIPVQMEELGLASALEELAYSVSQLLQVDCCFEQRGEPQAFDNTAATHLYRIAQESINNAARHGHARRIDLLLSGDPDVTSLRISDNGVGIPNAARVDTGMGMNIMRYRAKLVGGKLIVREQPQGGTTVVCVIHAANREVHERAA